MEPSLQAIPLAGLVWRGLGIAVAVALRQN
jgi:hypothetical protein